MALFVIAINWHVKDVRTSAPFPNSRRLDFYKDILIKPADGRRNHEPEDKERKTTQQRTTVLKKVIRYVLHLDQKKMENRKCLSEHLFGTIKRALGQYYFLLKGFAKVRAEMSLFCLVQPSACYQHKGGICVNSFTLIKTASTFSTNHIRCVRYK